MTTVNAIDVMKDFYELKKQYEEKYYQKYVQSVVKDQSKSVRERRNEYSKLPRPECISCQRNVGTIFSIKHHNEEPFRIFVAKCGDLQDPCPLNIHFQLSDRLTYEVSIQDTVSDLETIKKKIIQEKNEIMFGYKYTSDKERIAHDFNDLTQELKEKTEMAGFFIESNMLKNDNPERANLITKLEEEFGRELLLPFKNAIADYMKTNNDHLITKAVETYNTEMVPKLKDIQQLKYDVNYVDFEPVSEKYFLMQRKNSLESLEFGTTTNDVVHAFVKGGPPQKQQRQGKSRTQKKAGQETTKKRTRKLKPIMIEEEQPQQEELPQQQEEENPQQEEPKEDQQQGEENKIMENKNM